MAADWKQSVLGVAMAVLSILLASTGYVLQRKGHLLKLESRGGGKDGGKNADAAVAAHHSAARLLRAAFELAQRTCTMPEYQRLEIAGVILYIIASFPDLLAFALVPEVVCTTVESLKLVITLLLARVFLREPLPLKDLPWVACCMFGTMFCVWYGPYRSADDAAQVTVLDFTVWAYLTVGILLVLVLFLLEHSPAEKYPAVHRARFLTLPFGIALTFALEKILNTELGVSIAWREAESWETKVWLARIMLGIIVFALLNFYLVLRCARLFPVRTSAPLCFAFSTGVQLFQAIAILDEFRTVNMRRRVLVILGACISFLGAFCLEMSRVAREGEAEPAPDHGDPEKTRHREHGGARSLRAVSEAPATSSPLCVLLGLRPDVSPENCPRGLGGAAEEMFPVSRLGAAV